MENIQHVFEPLRAIIERYIDVDAAAPMLVAGPCALVAVGLILAVLGAKMARISMTTSFAMMGVVLGGLLGQRLSWSVSITPIIGGVVFGVCGWVLYRLWVGLATGLLLAFLAVGSYGSSTLLPQFDTYDAPPQIITGPDQSSATLGEAVRTIHLNPEFKEWLRGFWGHATASNKSMERNLGLFAAAAGIVGVLLGLLAVRFTLVMVTSVLGTGMLLAGATALVQQFLPEFYKAGSAHPQGMGVAAGTLLMGSLVLQGLLTRTDKRRRAKSEDS